MSALDGPAKMIAAMYPPMNSGPPSTLHAPMARARLDARTRATSASDPETPDRTSRKNAAAVSQSAATAMDIASNDAPESCSAPGSNIATTPQVAPDMSPST